MTMFDRADEDAESRFKVGWKSPDIVALGRWVNPAVGILGALVLGGDFLTATPVATALAPLVVAAPPPTHAPVPAQLALSSDTPTVAHFTAVQDESTRMSTIDLLRAVFGAVLALAWATIGAWLGVRRARALTSHDGRATLRRGRPYQRRNDETRLVPPYPLRRVPGDEAMAAGNWPSFSQAALRRGPRTEGLKRVSDPRREH
jgi:hypothetical protein